MNNIVTEINRKMCDHKPILAASRSQIRRYYLAPHVEHCLTKNLYFFEQKEKVDNRSIAETEFLRNQVAELRKRVQE